VARPRRVAVIVNGARPAARAALVELSAALAELDGSCAVTATLAEARGAVHRAVAWGAEVVLFGGGDGTLAMGLSLLAEACRDRAHPAVGVLPLGTGNAFARARELQSVSDRRDRRSLSEVLARARDAGGALDRFRPIEAVGVRAPFCGFGVDAQLIEDHAALFSDGGALGRALGRTLGRAAGALDGVLGDRALAARALRPLGYAMSVATRSLPRFALGARPRVTITNLGAPAQRIDERGRESGAPLPAGTVLWEGACTMAAAATIPCFGFGLRMFPYATRRLDRFHLRASDAGLLEILRNTRAAFAGTYTSPNVHDYLAERVAITISPAAPFEAGGEALGRLGHVELSLGPELPIV
jgi:diacylglycerol kinase family enzyme